MINPLGSNAVEKPGALPPAGQESAVSGGPSSYDGASLSGKDQASPLLAAHNIPSPRGSTAGSSSTSTVSSGTASDIILQGQTSSFKLWEFETGGPIASTPCVTSDGTVIFGSHDGRVYAVKDGKSAWEVTLGGELISSPQLTGDNVFLCSSSNGKAYAVRDGGKLWEFDSETQHGGGAFSYPVEGPDGLVYAGAGNGSLYFLYEGRQEYGIHIGDWILTPIIDRDGTVYVKSYSGKIGAYKYKNSFFGKKVKTLWEKEIGFAGQSSESSFAAGPDGTLYTGNYDGKLIAVRKGDVLWEFKTQGKINSTPTVGPDGTVYVGSDDGKLYAVRDGQKLWEFRTEGAVCSKPALGPDGTVYVGSDDGKVYGVKDGGMVWNFKTGKPVRSSPVIAADGTIYVTSYDKKLYALSREPVTERLTEMVQDKQDQKPTIIDDENWVIIDGKKLPKKN